MPVKHIFTCDLCGYSIDDMDKWFKENDSPLFPINSFNVSWGNIKDVFGMPSPIICSECFMRIEKAQKIVIDNIKKENKHE